MTKPLECGGRAESESSPSPPNSPLTQSGKTGEGELGGEGQTSSGDTALAPPATANARALELPTKEAKAVSPLRSATALQNASAGVGSEPPHVGSYGLSVKLTDFGIGQVVSKEYLKGITKAGFTKTLKGDWSSGTGTRVGLGHGTTERLPDRFQWQGSIRFTDAAGQPVKGISVTLDPGKQDPP